MQSGFLPFQQSVIHYLFGGEGKTVLICFHGYGESAANFNFLEETASKEFTIIAIDLPFHGKTNWKENLFDHRTIYEIVENILNEHSLNNHPLMIVGFSMGARIGLCLFEYMPGQINKLVLIAPDGLKINFWYGLATQTAAGKFLFSWLMKHPQWFKGLLQTGKLFGMVNMSIYKFVQLYIHDQDVRNKLYNRWIAMRKCKPRIKKIKSLINKHNIPVRLLYGKFDRIMLSSQGEAFLQGLTTDSKVQVLDCGHQILQSANAEMIMKALKH